MIKLVKHKGMGREMRQDDTPSELAIPTWTLAKDALKAGKAEESIRWIDYGALEDKILINTITKMSSMAMLYIDDNFGNEALNKFWGQSDLPMPKVKENSDWRNPAPALDLAKKAATAGRTDESAWWIDYLAMEDRIVHDAVTRMCDSALTYLADNYGEEQVEKFWRWTYPPSHIKQMLSELPSPKELFLRQAEYARAHQCDFTMSEEPDRYVRTNKICGSGCRMRRAGKCGVTKKPYPWSWGKKGIPYYCVHCSIFEEIVPIEVRGYPLRIQELGEKPEDPCIIYYYKKPELIPEQYFTRVGKVKPGKR
ncbi:hypothetical protein ACFLYX_00680 [Chloroflexota bacterium]